MNSRKCGYNSAHVGCVISGDRPYLVTSKKRKKKARKINEKMYIKEKEEARERIRGIIDRTSIQTTLPTMKYRLE